MAIERVFKSPADELYERGARLMFSFDESKIEDAILMLRQASSLGNTAADVLLANPPSGIDKSLIGLSDSDRIMILRKDAQNGGFDSAIHLMYYHSSDVGYEFILSSLLKLKNNGHDVTSYLDEIYRHIGKESTEGVDRGGRKAR